VPTKPTVKHSFEVGRVRSSGMLVDVVHSGGVQLCGQQARVVAHRGDDRRGGAARGSQAQAASQPAVAARRGIDASWRRLLLRANGEWHTASRPSIDTGERHARYDPSQSIVLGASRDSVLRHIYASMPLRRFLLADRLAPEALRPLASQLLFGDPLRYVRMDPARGP
jgi:hypothetical protein